MMPRLWFLLITLVPCVVAQSGGDASRGSSYVRVRIAADSNRACDAHTQVSLMSDSGSVVEGVVDSQCTVEFFGVAAGNYHVAVSGPNIVGSDNREFAVDNRGSQELDVAVRTSGESNPASTSPGMVATTDLKVPRNARKKFDRAGELIAKNDFPKALDQLHQAIGIYPAYAEAYNDLGVVYRRLGDNTQSREALQEALQLNDHLAPAYANLARLEIAGHNYSAAEKLLDKATATGLDDTPTLMLLASVELQTQHYDQAIANCHKAHATPQVPHAVAHYVAARAYEHENRLSDAVGELRTFLSEEQSGAKADEARKEIAALQAAAK